MQKYEKYKEKCKMFFKILKEKEKKCVSVDRIFTSSELGIGSVYDSSILLMLINRWAFLRLVCHLQCVAEEVGS
jgi:predicted transcriptional regulator